MLRGRLKESELDTDTHKKGVRRKELTPIQKMEISIVMLAASIGAILGILAYNFGWLG